MGNRMEAALSTRRTVMVSRDAADTRLSVWQQTAADAMAGVDEGWQRVIAEIVVCMAEEFRRRDAPDTAPERGSS